MRPSLFHVLVAALLVVLGGCDFSAIRQITILRPAPAYAGEVEVRLPDGRPAAQALFQMRIFTDRQGGLPASGFMERVKREGAARGASVLVFDCGPPGTVGEAYCTVDGYRL